MPTPANAESEQFIVAEVNPVDEKNIRVRGPLISVSEDAMTYTVGLRPFHDRVGDFGQVDVHVTDETEFEVNGEMFAGLDGLTGIERCRTRNANGRKRVLERCDYASSRLTSCWPVQAYRESIEMLSSVILSRATAIS